MTTPDILYIMGTGRSGSTILEVVLAAAEDTHGAGELFDVVEDGLERNLPCSCGQPFDRCPVWSPVSHALDDYRQDLRNAKALMRRIEWHIGFWAQWLGVGRLPQPYADFNRRMFETLRRHTGARTVVDSSKFAGRALALHRLYGSRLKVLWLVRKPAGILHSFRKPNKDEQRPKSTINAMLYIAYVTLCCRLARIRLGPDCLVMHYESIVDAPCAELQKLAQWSGMNLDDATRRIESGESFDVGHLLTANRIRKQGRVRVDRSASEPDGTVVSLGCAKALDLWYTVLGIRKH